MKRARILIALAAVALGILACGSPSALGTPDGLAIRTPVVETVNAPFAQTTIAAATPSSPGEAATTLSPTATMNTPGAQKFVPAVPAAPSALLHVQGNSLVLQNGQRFVVKGVNFEFFRDANGRLFTDGQYAKREEIASEMKSIGINAVRIDYKHSWLEQNSENLTELLAMVETFAKAGIYSMPSDHEFTGIPGIPDYASAYDSFRAIVEGARAMGQESYLIMNPYNESVGLSSDRANILANQDTLRFFRDSLGFNGVVVLDTNGWYESAFEEILVYDTGLLGGPPNVLFSNHRYPPTGNGPNNSWAMDDRQLTSANRFPLIVGELGQWNHGPVDPQFVATFLDELVSTAIPLGQNGAFAWIWAWYGPEAMTSSADFLTLNSYGEVWLANFYSKSLPVVAPTLQP